MGTTCKPEAAEVDELSLVTHLQCLDHDPTESTFLLLHPQTAPRCSPTAHGCSHTAPQCSPSDLQCFPLLLSAPCLPHARPRLPHAAPHLLSSAPTPLPTPAPTALFDYPTSQAVHIQQFDIKSPSTSATRLFFGGGVTKRSTHACPVTHMQQCSAALFIGPRPHITHC